MAFANPTFPSSPLVPIFSLSVLKSSFKSIYCLISDNKIHFKCFSMLRQLSLIIYYVGKMLYSCD